MKKLLIIPSLFLILTAFGQAGELSIIPQPAEMQPGTGSFRLKGGTIISYDNPSGKQVAEMLALKLDQASGFIIKVMEGSRGSIQLNINKEVNSQLGTEGYNLSVTSKNIIISANQPAGLFYGMQSLLQIMPPECKCAPAVNITDYPRFQWRGIMLDVSRNFFTKEEVKKYIDQISSFKFNIFHWHLTDDNGWRIEIKSLPKLTEVGAWRVARAGHFGDRDNPKPGEPATVGGFYTQEDIREIVKYAQERFITIVPEVDIPGHSMAAIASYPELCCTKNPDIKVDPGTAFSEWYGDGTFKMLVDNTLNPSDEKVYEFLDKVFTELAQLFPGQYIHVGGDECYKGYWEADAGCQALMKKLGMTKVEQLQGYFVDRVEKILQSKGKKLIGWDEILEAGISPNATVMSWRGVKGGMEAAKLGHYVIMTPSSFVYLDYQQGEKTIEPPLYAGLRLRKCYSFDPVPEGVDAKYILGGQGNLWTEQIPEFRHAEYMTWPRGWALAEDFWTPVKKKNWDDFIKRVERQFLRNDYSGINYSRAIFDPVISANKADGKTMVEMSAEAPGLSIYYTLDDQMPDDHSPEYTKPFEIPAGGPVTLRVIAYRDGKPAGHLITLSPDDLKKR
jgi:hexosaminidase